MIVQCGIKPWFRIWTPIFVICIPFINLLDMNLNSFHVWYRPNMKESALHFIFLLFVKYEFKLCLVSSHSIIKQHVLWKMNERWVIMVVKNSKTESVFKPKLNYPCLIFYFNFLKNFKYKKKKKRGKILWQLHEVIW